MKRKASLLRVAIVLAILISGLTLAASPGAAETGFPMGAHVERATFMIHVGASYATVWAHRITTDWDESTVTWNSFGGMYDPGVVGSFVADGYGQRTIDVTGLVQGWLDGAYPNYGLLLEQGQTDRTIYRSREHLIGPGPKLEICYSTPEIAEECVTLDAAGDTHISEAQASTNFGSEPWLYTGLVNKLEKQTLVRFDLPEVPEGCTLTPGYWKTHSKYGPAPYDMTWDAKSGGDASFFDTGQTYYQVLWTEPGGGNAFFILAHAYIAAEMNVLNGASIPGDVLDAWNQAGALLDAYDSSLEIPKKTADRDLAIYLAGILDDYNNGIIGPGHCIE